MLRASSRTAVAALVLGCSACSGATPAPPVQHPPASAPTTDATPGPAASRAPVANPVTADARPTPTIPPPVHLGEETVFDGVGAMDYAAYFVRVLEYTERSNDASYLRHESQGSCTLCVDEATRADTEAGQRLQEDGLRLVFREARLDHFDPEAAAAEVTVTVDRPAWQVFGPGEEVVEEIDAVDGIRIVTRLGWDGTRWRVADASSWGPDE